MSVAQRLGRIALHRKGPKMQNTVTLNERPNTHSKLVGEVLGDPSAFAITFAARLAGRVFSQAQPSAPLRRLVRSIQIL
eukprot:3479965-Rhodomonas_salina.2